MLLSRDSLMYGVPVASFNDEAFLILNDAQVQSNISFRGSLFVGTLIPESSYYYAIGFIYAIYMFPTQTSDTEFTKATINLPNHIICGPFKGKELIFDTKECKFYGFSGDVQNGGILSTVNTFPDELNRLTFSIPPNTSVNEVLAVQFCNATANKCYVRDANE